MSSIWKASLQSNRLFLRPREASMRGATAILSFVACATAFQYPQGVIYGRQNSDDNLLGGIYNRFHGPYSTQFYQRRYGQGVVDREYQKGSIYDQLTDSDEYNPLDNTYNVQSENQGLNGVYRQLYNKYSNDVYNKYLNKFYNYLNEYKRDYSTTKNDVEEGEGPVKNMDSEMVKKQKHVYQLLRFITNPVYDSELQEVYKTFSFDKYAENYETEAYEKFLRLWRNQAYLPKGSIFSVMNDQHVKQVQALFDLLRSAKDYDTFYKTSVWARQHINEGMFLYTYSVALVHRKDTQGLALPAIYELYPQYFFNSEVIQKAYQHKMSHFGDSRRSGIYTIRAEYSGKYLNLNPEQSLTYFTEDIGINAFYYYYNLYFPYWMNSKKYQLDEKRGELFYYVHHQLLARYYLERLSHGFGGLDFFNWDVPFETGYYPSLTYPNGLPFNERPNFANLQEYFHNYGQRWCFVGKYGYGYTYVNTYEQRIREAIDLGYAYTQDGNKVDLYTDEGLNILSNLIEGNADSPNYRYYGSYVNFARHLLGYSKQPLDNASLAPSAMEHFETSLRDPAFYQLSQKILLLFQKYKVNLPEYTEKDLHFPGVKVDRFEIEPLVTFYEKFYSDITNGVTVTPEEFQTDSTFRIQVEQYRLNHKTFNYKVYVDSDKATKANVRVFLGPKYDERGRDIEFLVNRNNFVELDQFIYNLKEGENVIVRNSVDFLWFGSDKTSYLDLYKHAMNEDFDKVYKVDDFMNGFPRRYMIPRGSPDGITYHMYVIVSPYKPHQSEITQTYYQTKYNQETVFTAKQSENQEVYDKMDQYKMVRIDSYPLGYPFDRPAEFQQTYFVPNAKMVDVKIHHQALRKDDVAAEDYFEERPKFFM